MTERKEPGKIILSDTAKEQVAGLTPEEAAALVNLIGTVAEAPEMGAEIKTEFTAEEAEKFKLLRDKKIIETSAFYDERNPDWDSLVFLFEGNRELELFRPGYTLDALGDLVVKDGEGVDLGATLSGFKFQNESFEKGVLRVTFINDQNKIFFVLSDAWILQDLGMV